MDTDRTTPQLIEMIVEKLHITEALDQLGIALQDVQACAESDRNREGDYSRRVLIVTADMLVVLDPEAGKPEVSIRRADIVAVKEEELFGGNALLVTCADTSTECILRYSTGRKKLLGSIGARINEQAAWKRTQDGIEPPHDFRDVLEESMKLHCPTCDRPIEKGVEFCPVCLKKGRTLLRLLSLAKPYKWRLLAVSFLMLAGTALYLVPPYLIKLLVDMVLLNGRTEWRISLLLGIIGAYAFANLLRLLRGRLACQLAHSMTKDLRDTVYKHIQRLDMAFFDQQKVGKLIARVHSDPQRVNNFLASGLQMATAHILMLFGVGAMLLWLSPLLGTVVVLVSLCAVGVTGLVWRRIKIHYRKTWGADSRLISFESDSLSGIRVTKTFGRANDEIAKFEERSGELKERFIAADRLWLTVLPVIILLFEMATFLVWWLGSGQVLDEKMTLGTLMAFVAYISMFIGPLTALTEIGNMLMRSLTSAERIFEILDRRPLIIDPKDPKPIKQIKGHIELRDVSFRYRGSPPAINKVSLEIQPGECIGIVGPSGAGKTTLMELISRMRDPDRGEVLIDGINVKELSTQQLRSQIGVVHQDPFLFSGTLDGNICYSKPGAEKADILASAVAARAAEFMTGKPNLFQTFVGERGKGLSGGERQRIAIARAILQNPSILVMDEATSSLDTETESKVQEALAQLVKDRTTIIVAHRLSTLRDVDRIIVMDKGRIVEQGTHDALLAHKGVYARLVRAQERKALNSTVALGVRAQLKYLDPAKLQFSRAKPHAPLQLTIGDMVYVNVKVARCYPLILPSTFINISDEEGESLGFIATLRQLNRLQQQLLREELERRHIIPRITKIISLKDEHYHHRLKVETTRGDTEILLGNPPNEFIKRLSIEKSRMYNLIDLARNRYVLDLSLLDERSKVLLELLK